MYKKLFLKFSYFLLTSTICLGTLEIFSRIIKPIFPGFQLINLDGERLEGVIPNTPSASYFQYSNEYKAKTNINERGIRVTPNSKKLSLEGVIFLGDSQTFGQGLSDEETIASKFCELSKKEINCINLGVPGANTISQLEKLKDFANEKDIENFTVFNLLHASTVNAFSGNDVSDCLAYGNKNEVIEKNNYKRKDFLLKIGRSLSRKSNLFRLVRFNIASKIKTYGFVLSPNTVFDRDIECFVKSAGEIKSFTNSLKARYLPIIISPSAEIAMGLRETNLNKIKEVFDENALSPDNILLEDFYPIDGHYNASGAEKIARFLLTIY